MNVERKGNTSTWKYTVIGIMGGLYIAVAVIVLVYAVYAGLGLILLTAAAGVSARLIVNARDKRRLKDFERYLEEKNFRTEKRLLVKTTNQFAGAYSVVGLWIDYNAGKAAFRLSRDDSEAKIYSFSDLSDCGVECDFTTVRALIANPGGRAVAFNKSRPQRLYTAYFLWVGINPGTGRNGSRLYIRLMPANSNSMSGFAFKKSQTAVRAAVDELRSIIGGRGQPETQRGHTPPPENVLFGQTYKNEAEGFSFHCPEGWKTGINLTDNMIIYFIAPPTLNSPASVCVAKSRSNQILAVTKSDFEADLTNRFREVRALALTDIVLDGVPAKRLSYIEKNRKGRETAHTQYLYAAGENAYIVTCTIRQSAAGIYTAVFEDIMDSYKIIPVER